MLNTTSKKTNFLSKLQFLKKYIIIAFILFIAVFAFQKLKKPEIQTVVSYIDSTASIGSIVHTLDSSGTIEVYETLSISSAVSGDILQDNLKLSDFVEKDQLLYTIDSKNADDDISQAEKTLTKYKDSYQDILDSIADLNVKSSMAGTVLSISSSVGDSVSSSTVIACVTNLDILEISLPFHKTDVENINIGDSALVLVSEFGETISGVVTNVSNGSYILNSGSLVSEVCIEVSNPGILTDNHSASATINDISCAETSNFAYKYSSNITAGTSGKLSALNIMKGDYVSLNQVVAVLTDDSLSDALSDAKSLVDDANSDYQDALDTLKDYVITSPISGTILQKNYNTGDVISSSNNSTNVVLATVADMSKMKFEMVVDEINISKINLDSPVIVTADAIDNKTFDGYIESISLIGSQSSGVTTYPIIVVIEDADGLLPGMNVTADIIIEQSLDSVIIPSSYVSRGNTVLISSQDAQNYKTSSDGTPGTISQNQTGIDGYSYLNVELGISDGNSVVITSGLDAGTKIYMQTIITTKNTELSNENGVTFDGMTGGMTGFSSDRVTNGTTNKSNNTSSNFSPRG